MIKEKLDGLIRESMLAKTPTRTEVLRSIKTKFMELETAKNAKELDEVAAIRKMIADRENSANIYQQNCRLELAIKEIEEARILKEFVPESPSEDDIRICLTQILSQGIELSKKNTGIIMKEFRERLPMADMKLVSTIIRGLMT